MGQTGSPGDRERDSRREREADWNYHWNMEHKSLHNAHAAQLTCRMSAGGQWTHPRIGLRPLAGQCRLHFRLVAGTLQRWANGHHNAARIGWRLLHLHLLILLRLCHRQTGPMRGRGRQCILLQIGADTRVLAWLLLLLLELTVGQRRASLVATDGMTLRPVEIGRAMRLWRGTRGTRMFNQFR